MADITLNGHLVGPAWNPPYEVEITRELVTGTNTLSITVANLPINRFLGSPDLDLGPLRAVYGNRFPDPEEKRLPQKPPLAGLVGPVKLRFTP